MCEPTTLVALSIASTAASVYGQQQAADAQAAANQRQYQNTVNAMNANVNQTNLMALQEREAAMQKLEANNAQARAAMSRATVASGESGIAGRSVDQMLGDLSFKENTYNSSVMTNLDRANSAIQQKRDNIYFDAASAINGLKTPQNPDYLGAALKIGNSINDYNKQT